MPDDLEEELIEEWTELVDVWNDYPRAAPKMARTLFEIMLKIIHRKVHGEDLPDKTFSSGLIKKINPKRQKLYWQLNDDLNDISHHRKKERREDEFASILGRMRQFCITECDIELSNPSPNQDSLIAEWDRLKQQSSLKEKGGFRDHPDTCPHCENYIRYINIKTGLSSQWDEVQSSMAWRVENDRNYCPFCLREEYIPFAKKQIPIIALVHETVERWNESLNQVIRQEGFEIEISKHMIWEMEVITDLYEEITIGKMPINELDEVQRPRDTIGHQLGRIVLQAFRQLEMTHLPPGFLEHVLREYFGTNRDLDDFEWRIDILDSPEQIASKIPRMYMDFMNMRLVPFDETSCTVQVFPHYTYRDNEDIDFSVIHHNGVCGILKDVFDLYGASELTPREIFTGLVRLECPPMWDMAPQDSPAETKLESIPDYCRKWLDYRIEESDDNNVVLFSLKTDVELKPY